MADEKISRSEAARRLGVSVQTIRRLETEGKLRTYPRTTGFINRVSAEDVVKYLKNANKIAK